ncbi:hypothetical protein ACWDWU_38725 [Streptomyces sp. NPDC003442]
MSRPPARSRPPRARARTALAAVAAPAAGALRACGGTAGAGGDGKGSSVTLRVGATGWKEEAAAAVCAGALDVASSSEIPPVFAAAEAAPLDPDKGIAALTGGSIDAFAGQGYVHRFARVLADRHATEAVALGSRLLGNPGLSRDNPLERHFRDVQCAPVHAPQEDTALLAIGTAALGTRSERPA